MSFYCYAQRLLNPFRGVMNVVEHGAAEAVTTDGIHWDIYVRNIELLKDIADTASVQTSDIRYGSWSLREGLRRGPIQPSEDFKRMEAQGEEVYQFLLDHHQDVPFSLADNYELWLIDKTGQPFALINSSIASRQVSADQDLRWRAGYLCERTFQPNCMDALATELNAATYFSQYVNNLTGHPPQAQWFVRDASGGRAVLDINMPSQLSERYLPSEAFPSLLLRINAEDKPHAELYKAFLTWQAPWLLLLHDLADTDRVYYEVQARRQAIQTSRCCRLYPRVLDKSFMNSVRVEAQLRSTQKQTEPEQDDISIFYIELGKEERGK